MGVSVAPTEIEALVRREHRDPHAVLGPHLDREAGGDGLVIRVLRPSARSVTVELQEDATPAKPGATPAKPGATAGAPPATIALEQVHPAGLFEGVIESASLPLRYRLALDYGPAGSFTVDDPYAFSPTVGELDLHLIGEGRHEHLYDTLGAHVREHEGVSGTAFALWAPAARAVSVVGDFNSWDGRLHAMRSLGSGGIWELFLPGVAPGARYKYELLSAGGELALRADPYAQETEQPPQTASVVFESNHRWSEGDAGWLRRRAQQLPLDQPVSIYEVHLGSWRLSSLEGDRPLTYLELADELAAYVTDMGFTHVELLPVMAHPFTGSWGYQVTGYFAPTPLHGSADDLRELVDRLHGHGIGVLLDWVPAHFPRDEFALARFDGTALYEHDDPRRGAHPDWGTLVFNYGRHEVRNFLIANALFWLREYHVDGIRVDAVASMLYLDYSRREGEWVPNEFGGREDLDAVTFLKELNVVIYGAEPGIISAAEESTAWPGVSRPTYLGGLGFGFKWNMGWMHDTLGYFAQDPVYRRYHHHELTFSLMYAFSENFILPLSHDEVVHGKGSLYSKMAGDRWQKLANLRALYAYMWAHPGKKLLFMGSELAQEAEWSHERSLDWHLLESPENAGIQTLVRDLNRAYCAQPALWEDGDPSGFWWLEPNDADRNVIAFARASHRSKGTEGDGGREAGEALAGDAREPGPGLVLVCAANLSPVPQTGYRLGLPRSGRWREVLNTDSAFYGGGDLGNLGGVQPEPIPWHDQQFSAEVTLPPLAAIWLVPEAQ